MAGRGGGEGGEMEVGLLGEVPHAFLRVHRGGGAVARGGGGTGYGRVLGAGEGYGRIHQAEEGVSRVSLNLSEEGMSQQC